MKNNELSIRLFNFSVKVFKLFEDTPYRIVTKPIISQVIRSATSVGANYEEAQASISRAEFISKIHISLKEIRETNYWLRICKATFLKENVDVNYLINESEELKLILGAIAYKSRQNMNVNKRG